MRIPGKLVGHAVHDHGRSVDLPGTVRRAPVLPERMFVEAVLYLARTGIPWRDLPSEFRAWDTVYNRFRRWIASGSLARLFVLLTDNPAFGEVKHLLIDATHVRAHRCAAGAAKKRGPRRTKGLVGAAAVLRAKSY